MDAPSAQVVGLKCRVCRNVLFNNSSYFKCHSSERKASLRSKPNALTSEQCSHYFLDQDTVLQNLPWLEKQIQTGSSHGPISCEKCEHKLGTFNWTGAQCSCGAWQIPFIGIIKSKVDPVKEN